MFAPARNLDPLRVVHGTGTDRYDCPDLATLDRHLRHLRRRVTGPAADRYRADIDRLLDRRSWLTLPVGDRPSSRSRRDRDTAVRR